MTEKERGRETSAEAMLAERIGLDPQAIGPSAIARALDERMSALGLRDRDDYLRRLSGSVDEQQELIEEVVIPESWFFRDEHPFEALRAHVAAKRDGDPKAPPLRTLSVPCACGEEPYSIAITLLDLGFPPDRFQIDAVDISARHLAVAERGVYRANSFRGNDLAFRDRYFRAGPHPHAHAPSFTLDPSVRATVRFTRGNLLDPHLLHGQPRYDVIFCRNVLIYLDAASRRRAFDTLDRLLGPAGLLFVGHAERLAIADPRFEPWGENSSFAHCRATGRAPRSPHASTKVPPPKTSGRGNAKPATTPAINRTDSTQADNPSKRDPSEVKPAVLSPMARSSVPEPSAALLDEAATLADRGRNDEAAAHCEAFLGRFGPDARAFFLLGMVRQAGGRIAEAEACFRKTIYLDPGHDEALLALALLAQRRGDPGAAAGYRRRAQRARAKKGTT